MFHRANGGAIKPQTKKEAEAQYKVREGAPKTGMDQTAVRQYRSPQDEGSHSLDQNSTVTHAQSDNERDNKRRKQETVKKLKIKLKTQPKTQPKTKEENPMNNPQAKNKPQENPQPSTPAQPQGQSVGRVDIPGNNFQRPGVAGQATRPSYPGASYPGASAPAAATNNSNYSTQPAQVESGRQLNIGQGITMSGEIEACDHLVVEGTVEAALKGANVLEIAESGAFYGTVEIEEATIAGRFEGDITVRGRLTIEATGVVIGSIAYKELAIEAGATLDGSVSPIGSENATQNQTRSNKKASSKAKKVSQNNGAELPFSDRAAAE